MGTRKYRKRKSKERKKGRQEMKTKGNMSVRDIRKQKKDRIK